MHQRILPTPKTDAPLSKLLKFGGDLSSNVGGVINFHRVVQGLPWFPCCILLTFEDYARNV